MTLKLKLKKEILDKIESLQEDRLEKLLLFIEELEKLERKKKILSFAGKFKNINEEIFNDLTVNLHKNRKTDIRQIKDQ